MHDDTGFESVLAAHGAMIARIADAYEASPAVREELVQEIALALWRAMPRFRRDASLRTFVARIAHNRAVSHVAREVRRPKGDPISPEHPAAQPPPDQVADEAKRREALREAVRELPLPQRQVVTLALEGLSHAEIAALVGATANGVAIRLTRAKKALRERLGARS